MNTVVFDLDDTLLHDDLTISPYTVKVLRKLHEKGFHIIAASGRARLSMKPFVNSIGCIEYYIACNGAEIWKQGDGQDELIVCRMLPAETAKDIAVFAEEHDCYAQVYEGSSFFFNKYCDYAEKYASSARLSGVFAGKLSLFIHEPRNKVLLMDSPEKIAFMYRKALSLFAGRAAVTCSKPHYLEFNPPGTSKGNALETLSSCLGFRCEDAIAFGDSLNDVSLFEKAGISVLVSNGWDSVRAYCDRICGSNNEDGPAHFLEDMFLSPEVII